MDFSRKLALIIKADTLCNHATLWRDGIRCHSYQYGWCYLTFEQAEAVTSVEDIFEIGEPLHGYEDEDPDEQFFISYPEAECWYEEWDCGDDERTLRTRSYITPRYEYPFE